MADTHIAVAVIFDVPEGQDASSHKAKFYAKSRGGTKELLYYGFASCGSKILCREGYKTAGGFLTHVGEVKEDLEALIKQVGKEKVLIVLSGPESELEKIKPHMDGRLTIKYAALDTGSLLLSPFPTSAQDTHVTIIPEFIVPEDRMEDFKAGFAKFYSATKAGAGAAGMIFYGFAISGNSVYCREAYKSAEVALQHGADVKEMIQEPLKVVGAGNIKLNVVGPPAELEKLRPRLAPRGAVFWELDSQAFWM